MISSSHLYTRIEISTYQDIHTPPVQCNLGPLTEGWPKKVLQNPSGLLGCDRQAKTYSGYQEELGLLRLARRTIDLAA
jgi:hypothetical protein